MSRGVPTRGKLRVSVPLVLIAVLENDVREGRADHLSDAATRVLEAGIGKRRVAGMLRNGGGGNNNG